MSVTWPWALVALLAAPLLLAFRWWMRRRRRRGAIRMSNVALIRAAIPPQSAWRRRIPVALFVAGLVVLGGGVARPQASVLVPSNASTILLAIDVSRSMCSTDVDPNRLTAAQNAAREFIRAQDGSRIGLVAFAGLAGLLVPPTTDQDELLSAIDTLTTSRGTAIGLAILKSIDAIAEINPNVAPTGVELPTSQAAEPADTDYEPDTIVVLTDGANSQGVEPVVAAQQAAARHLRVYTIGFGTTEPAQMVCSPNQLGAGAATGNDPQFGGGGGGGFGRLQLIDEPTLTQVAQLTGGEYFRAESTEGLTDVLLDLPSSIVLQRQDVEITVWFALAGAVLILLAVGLSLWWNRSRPETRLRLK